MAFVAVEKDGTEFICKEKPTRNDKYWQHIAGIGEWGINNPKNIGQKLEKGTIEKLIGKKLTWEDKPVELKEQNGFQKGGYIENSHVYAGVIKC